MRLSPTLAAAVALIGFWLVEFTLRKRGSASSLATSAVDRASTVAIVCAYVLVAVCLTISVGGPRLPLAVRWVAAVLAMAGLTLRVVAFRTLGASYSRTLRVTENQALVTQGVYAVIRHPGYASAIAIWCGAAAASGWLVGFVLTVLILTCVYVYRIRAEEAMLLKAFGAHYQAYRARSWRLIPYIY